MILEYSSNNFGLPFVQMVLEGFTPELQWSNDFNIFVVLSGNVSVHYKNHTRDMNPYDIFFFQPFETYSFIKSTKDAQVLNISFNSQYIRSLCPEVEEIVLQQSHVTKNMGNPIYISMCQDFATIIYNNLKNELCTKMKLLDAANNLLISIFDNYGEQGNAGEKGKGYAQQRVSDIMSYINEHYSEKLSVTDISASLGLHPQYFSSFFSKYFKTSFVDYLTTFRINQSLSRLIYSKDSILDIAIDCGFANHKTYAAAFKKQYSITPTTYRKQMQEAQANSAKSNMANYETSTNKDFGALTYFRQFLLLDDKKDFSLKTHQSLHLNARELSAKSTIVNQEKFMSVGRAFACLRSDIQSQLRDAHKDLNYNYLRIRDIFSDDLYIYYENESHEPSFNWQNLDTVFDFLIDLGVHPFPEIGFMPELLASKKQYAGWQFHPNVSAPKSIEKWRYLIKSFLEHYIDRYGIIELRQWYFDFWTCPDLQMKPAYWNESMQDFFDFYKATYEVFKSVDRELRLGTPSFSTINGRDWYIAFFEFCKKFNIQPAYLSIHLYACEPTLDFYSPGEFGAVDYASFTASNQNYISESLTDLINLMSKYATKKLDIIVSDWSLTFLSKDYVRDTCFMSAFIAHTYVHTLEKVKGLCYWSISDIHEEYFPENAFFHGGPGMLSTHGLKKASYNAYSLINKLGSSVLDYGDNYLFIKKMGTYQLLLYNLAEFDESYELMDNSSIDETHRYSIYKNTEDLSLDIMIELPAGSYYIKRYEVSRQYGSAYDIWAKMGFPASLPKDMEDFIREESQPHISYMLQDTDGTLMIDELVPIHGLVLLEITKK